jgi:DNA-binding FadR family transcriptional regulator
VHVEWSGTCRGFGREATRMSVVRAGPRVTARSGRGLKPVRTALRYREVRDRIRDYILDNRLRGGDPLPSESSLATQLGVSRNAVREGLRSLEAQGILEVRAGSGSFVREIVLDDLLASFTYSLFFDRDAVDELYLIRQKLEENFLPPALANLSPDTVTELHQLLSGMGGCASWGPRYLDYDIRLHRAIFSGVGNRTLLKLFDIFRVINQRASHVLKHRPASELRDDFAAHVALVEAVERRDLPAARRALRRSWAGFPTLSLEARVQAVPSRPAKPPRAGLNSAGTRRRRSNRRK